jgi:glycosyltransferase involved in cell wall biosynthesis
LLLGWSGATALTGRQIRGLRLRLRRRFARAATGWIAYGPEARDYLVHLGAAPGLVEPAGNPYGIATQTPRGGGQSTVRVGFAGQLDWRKAWWVPVQAARMAAGDNLDVELVLVGDGPGRPLLERLLANQPEVRALWRRHIPPDEMPRFYSDIDLLIVPSLVDQWPIVASEAVAAGLPVACTPSRYSGAPALVSTATEGRGPGPGAILDVARIITEISEESRAGAVAKRIQTAQEELAPATVACRWASLVDRARYLAGL